MNYYLNKYININFFLIDIDYSKKLILVLTLFLCNKFDNNEEIKFINPLSFNAIESILNEKLIELKAIEEALNCISSIYIL